ncbi:glycosyltransferase family 2 protein [Aetokthonos hydrillicola Thurmond2011]|jgi:1,2-diacylglycerol 3-beta-glucosyltransferase|uniref:Beta-monoglucosyldiacylglycerol synthase n=1 Tax=Aetokthonos hydrillicola Thurmond2011 TaxID=2712845 RepID=A0AAP5I1C4_9CYAN|nr:glycosyltransferase family 2 protein [Aetokthonos hydrillicola]MBW4590203.1 glycosyltransferase family 2 protein [Aetokthonos hydrillicola CCALA 1050]MDR9893347.1 glycosyltransferase family 2 protein [Aetokthonos hydrillicola Thurmond2011]
MPANSWPENDSYNEFDPLNSLFSELSSDDEELVEEASNSMSLPSRFQGRRRKAALVLTIVWSGTIALHLVSWGFLFVLGLTTVLGIHALVVVFAKPRQISREIQGELPYVSVLVAAKNEEAVIGNLVKNLCSLEYPEDRYEVWIVDDNSTDKTPELLAGHMQEYANLKVLRRKPKASGGKSGALNEVLQLSKGEIVAVFDADAKVPPDLLSQVVPLFEREEVGAVQVRKAIANHDENFWTQGQMVEMALDAYFQEQRTAIGGIGELRGNGQFVRRKALVRCGGWNEETITDDLDLTVRLHLDNWDIDCLFHPAVEEEGVTTALSLWHQRNRWAEGGYQRYLDYWDLILRNRMGTRKTWDLFLWSLTQYVLPTAAIPDLLMAIARHRLPMLGPVTTFTITMSMAGMLAGLRRIRRREKEFKISSYFLLLLQTIRGTLYMFHWIVVMSSTTARMSVRPKRLKWVKTVHQGSKE